MSESTIESAKAIVDQVNAVLPRIVSRALALAKATNSTSDNDYCPLEFTDMVVCGLRKKGFTEGKVTLFVKPTEVRDMGRVGPGVEVFGDKWSTSVDLDPHLVARPLEGWVEKGVYLNLLVFDDEDGNVEYVDADLATESQDEIWAKADNEAYMSQYDDEQERESDDK